ncbi:MAG: CAP domain-containing protein [Lachnospiraceae bacterium]|nr:CAP domain-containing protein [Lachnospiraceae bacterium]
MKKIIQKLITMVVASALIVLSIPVLSWAAGEKYSCDVTYTLDSANSYVETIKGGYITESSAGFTNAVIRIYDANQKEIDSVEASVNQGIVTCSFENLKVKPMSAKCTKLEGSYDVINNGSLTDDNGLKGTAVISNLKTITPAATTEPAITKPNTPSKTTIETKLNTKLINNCQSDRVWAGKHTPKKLKYKIISKRRKGKGKGFTYNYKETFVKLYWRKVKGATGYEVYRQGNASKKWILVTSTKSNRAAINEVSKNYQVRVKVRAYKTQNGKKTYSAFSGIKKKTFKKNYYYDQEGLKRFYSEINFLKQNSYRKKDNAKPLKWSEELYELAALRGPQMMKNFSHFKPGGGLYSKDLIVDRYGNDIYEFLHQNNSVKSAGSKLLSAPAKENILNSGGLAGPDTIKSLYYHDGHHQTAKDTKFRYGAVAIYQLGTIKKDGDNSSRMCANFDKSNYDVSTGNMYQYVKTKSTKVIKNSRKAFDKRGITY